MQLIEASKFCQIATARTVCSVITISHLSTMSSQDNVVAAYQWQCRFSKYWIIMALDVAVLMSVLGMPNMIDGEGRRLSRVKKMID